MTLVLCGIGFSFLVVFAAGCFYVAGTSDDIIEDALNQRPYGDHIKIPSEFHSSTHTGTGV